MDACEPSRFHVLYAQHPRALSLQGKAPATIDGYARAVRRVARFFDRCPDQHAFALAKVFRAKLLHALHRAGLSIPIGLPPKWIVNCRNIGRGEPALEYVSRYLYRGVVRERDLVHHDPRTGAVTFRYIDANTHKPAYRKLPIEDFLWRILLHVLPTGLRRVRDYGFLHGKAKPRLTLVQMILRVLITATTQRPRPPMRCPKCHTLMHIVNVGIPRRPDG